MLKTFLIVGLGSFLGGGSRFLCSRFIQAHIPHVFPWGTLAVNVAGCLLIGLFYGLSAKGNLGGDSWKMFLTVGFCGGFTTFSTFVNENFQLIKSDNLQHFLLYTVGSFLLGMLALCAGHLLAKVL